MLGTRNVVAGGRLGSTAGFGRPAIQYIDQDKTFRALANVHAGN